MALGNRKIFSIISIKPFGDPNESKYDVEHSILITNGHQKLTELHEAKYGWKILADFKRSLLETAR